MRKLVALLLFGSLAAWAATVDGKWVAKVENKKGTQEIAFNLKAEDGRLSGSVAMGKRLRSIPIAEGKIEGDKITFVTESKGRKQQQAVKMVWTATVTDNELKGSSQREGGRRGRPFTAVRQP